MRARLGTSDARSAGAKARLGPARHGAVIICGGARHSRQSGVVGSRHWHWQSRSEHQCAQWRMCMWPCACCAGCAPAVACSMYCIYAPRVRWSALLALGAPRRSRFSPGARCLFSRARSLARLGLGRTEGRPTACDGRTGRRTGGTGRHADAKTENRAGRGAAAPNGQATRRESTPSPRRGFLLSQEPLPAAFAFHLARARRRLRVCVTTHIRIP